MTAPLPLSSSETVSRERYVREKLARIEAEKLLEERSRELYEANQNLAAALEKEKQLVTLQYALITSINHEFRTPLTIIDGVAARIEKITDGTQKDRVLENCSQIRRAVGTLTRLIENSFSGFDNQARKVASPAKNQPRTRQPMSDRLNPPGQSIARTPE